MSDDSSGASLTGAIIFLSILAYNSNLFESNKVTEYTQAERCAFVSSVVKDVKTGKPIKQDENGQWQWYTPSPSERTCYQDNLNKVNYRTYGEAGRVVAWGDEGELKGWMVAYRDCIIADAKNWTCLRLNGR
jgi:hypothetical protein